MPERIPNEVLDRILDSPWPKYPDDPWGVGKVSDFNAKYDIAISGEVLTTIPDLVRELRECRGFIAAYVARCERNLEAMRRSEHEWVVVGDDELERARALLPENDDE